MTKIKFLIPFLLIVLLIPLYIILYKIFIPRVNGFGCFDDCFNIMGGYFILKGKTLYSQIFFNHQMLMAYISSFLQFIKKPENIYELILIHRQFLLLYSFIFSTFLIIRYRFVAFGFILFYEFSKFYLFGNRFLAESFIVYPLVYMFGIIWLKIKGKHIYTVEYFIVSICTWIVVFMREPYIPLSLFLFFTVLFLCTSNKIRLLTLLCFILLAATTIFIHPFQDYLFNVFTINQQTVFAFETTQHTNIFDWLGRIFFYPVFIFFGESWNIFRYLLVGLSAIFLLLLSVHLTKKRVKLVLYIILTLGLANLRVVDVGHVFYESFHLLPWYALFIFIIFLLVEEFSIYKKNFITYLLYCFLALLFLFFIIHPQSYIHDIPHPHEDLITNYGKELQTGEVIQKLSNVNDTLFLDGFDDLIYWQADLISTYPYSWYTSVMPYIEKYRTARSIMFRVSPPTFYYGSCPKETISYRLLPINVKQNYVRLYEYNKPSCLFIYKEKLKKITKQQWKAANEFGYSLEKK